VWEQQGTVTNQTTVALTLASNLADLVPDAGLTLAENEDFAGTGALGPMAFAFEKGGDPEVLDSAYRFFRWMVDGKQCSTYTHKDAFAFVPLALRLGLLEDYRGADVRKQIPKKKAKGGRRKAKGKARRR
jgi:hypothetical protein